jgi:hypothetical protein
MILTSYLIPVVLLANSLSQAQSTLKPGSYVKSTYIQALKKTKSPFKSVGTGGVLEIVVYQSNGKTILNPIVNFHDSGSEYVLRGNSMAVRSDDLYPEENFQIDHLSASSFSVKTPGAFNGTFEFVDSIDAFLRSQTIAGEYLDSKNRKWVFGVDGKASIPNIQSTYQVGCDHFEAQFDYLYGPDINWAFELHDTVLKLFKCNDDGPANHEPVPFVILKRVSK